MTVLRFPYQAERVETYQVTQRKKVSHVIQRELMGKNPRWMRRQEEAYQMCIRDRKFHFLLLSGGVVSYPEFPR